MKKCRFIHFIALLLFPCILLALPKNDPVPGGVIILPFQLQSAERPSVYFENHKGLLLKSKKQNEWIAVIGLPLTLEPGDKSLTIQSGGQQYTLTFHVSPTTHPVQHITLPSNTLTHPNDATTKQMAKEQAKLQTLFNTWTPLSYVDTTFVLPVQGRFSAPFGVQRIFNGQPWGFHKGLDIAAPEGTPVHAAAYGRVLATGQYLLTGNTVLVNHGQGVITLYAHLSKITTHVGDIVTPTSIIGEVGTTGRSTAPHLHWGVNLNGVRVDPSLFIAKTNQT